MRKINFTDLKNEIFTDIETKKEYDNLEDEFTLAKEVIELRKNKHMTQKELAKEIGTSQPAIARLESGNYQNISLKFLRKVATALDATPEVHLKRKAQ